MQQTRLLLLIALWSLSPAAQAYLEFLYSPAGQEIVAKNYYRPRNADIAAKYAGQFANVELVGIDHFGGWKLAQKQHFSTGGVFDQITATKP